MEGLVLVAIGLVLPPRPRRIVAALAGILLGVLTIAKILNIAFYEYVDRAFNPVYDWGSIGSALGVVRDEIGPERTDIALVLLGLGLVLLVGAITAATIHITNIAARHRRAAVRGLAGLTAVWAVCAGLSLQFVPASPIASTSAFGLAVAQVRATQAAFSDERIFERAIHSSDPEARIPASDLLTGLRGKDVIIAFVESYGQVSIQGASFSAGIDAALHRDNASLARAGWSAQTAWVTAPGYGGISQEAHSTLQSGLWVNSRQRYSELVSSSRFTLSDAFDKAGWRTVSDSPATDDASWPSGTQFFHFDQLYDRSNVGYLGPTFSYAPMPDQYILASFQRLELAPGHKPVMAEIDLVSSHSPWAPLPTMVPWNKVGNGSIFDPMPARGERPLSVLASARKERKAYATSIKYSLRRPHLMGHRVQRSQPRAHPARRRATRHPHHQPGVQSQRADLDHRARPVRVQADCLLALAERAGARAPCSARAHERLPQQVPRGIQHGHAQDGAVPLTPQHRNCHGER